MGARTLQFNLFHADRYLFVQNAISSGSAPLRKRMRGKVVVLVAVVVSDLASDPVRQGDDGLLVRELDLRHDKRRVRVAPLTALFHS